MICNVLIYSCLLFLMSFKSVKKYYNRCAIIYTLLEVKTE